MTRKSPAPTRLPEQKWELDDLGTIWAGRIRIAIDAPPDAAAEEAELARAIVCLPALVVNAERAWALLMAAPGDAPTIRVRDDLAAILTQIGGRHA